MLVNKEDLKNCQRRMTNLSMALSVDILQEAGPEKVSDMPQQGAPAGGVVKKVWNIVHRHVI